MVAATHARWSRGRLAGLLLAGTFAACLAQAAPQRLLDDAQWRSDVQQALAAVRDHHPAPYRHIDRAAFDAAETALLARIPGASDLQIFIELSRLLGQLRDGHTRLGFERTEAARKLPLEAGHRPRPVNVLDTLRFASLPVALAQFGEAVYVVAASSAQRDLIGLEVLAFDAMGSDKALALAGELGFADNAQRRSAVAPSRLEMPQILYGLGIAGERGGVTLQFRARDGAAFERRLVADDAPLATDDDESLTQPPVCRRSVPEPFSWSVQGDALRLRVDELEGMPAEPVSVRLTRALAEAEARGATRVVLDLRCNFGGDASWNKAYVKALRASQFNNYGKLYVLIGRNTYSAAVRLALDLENLSEAIFVGEPAGSAPGFSGDPVRITLTHSGLDLRVSRLPWPSYLAGDFRETLPASLAATPSAEDFFTRTDRALQIALAHRAPADLAAQMRELFAAGYPQEALLRFMNRISDPGLDVPATEQRLLELGNSLLEQRQVRDARFVFTVASEYLAPHSALLRDGLERARRAGDSTAAQ